MQSHLAAAFANVAALEGLKVSATSTSFSLGLTEAAQEMAPILDEQAASLSALQSRVKIAEQERDDLVQRLQLARGELNNALQCVQEGEQEALATQRKAELAKDELQRELRVCEQEREDAHQQLKVARAGSRSDLW
jgi:DNA repair exonuclease SbcCD ATPase subunit